MTARAPRTHRWLSPAPEGEEALPLAAARAPDIVALDFGLPDHDGVQVIAHLRATTHAPILVLSGRTDSADKVDALDAGADDYVTKPFGVEELPARLRGGRGRPGRPAGRGDGTRRAARRALRFQS